jgi:ABC-type sugar transport system permease subunit
MATMIYRQAIISYDMQSAAATSVLLLALTLILVTLYYRVAHPMALDRTAATEN